MTANAARRVCLALFLLLVAAAPRAREAEPFSIRHADFSLNGSMLRLDLAVDSRIPKYILLAIDQGFAVPLMFEVEIRSPRNWWFDPKIVSLKQQYLLHHQPMLDAYVVLDLNSSERHYFAELDDAVQYVEVVYNYPMLDVNNLVDDREYYARVRFGIDTDELPQPLKSSSLWDNNWNLKSDWYEWEVEQAGL